VSCLAVS